MVAVSRPRQYGGRLGPQSRPRWVVSGRSRFCHVPELLSGSSIRVSPRPAGSGSYRGLLLLGVRRRPPAVDVSAISIRPCAAGIGEVHDPAPGGARGRERKADPNIRAQNATSRRKRPDMGAAGTPPNRMGVAPRSATGPAADDRRLVLVEKRERCP